MRPSWIGLLLIQILVFGSFAEDNEGVEKGTDEEKEAFVPATFITPSLSIKPYFFDYFPTSEKIGDRWIASKAKKDEADAEISKYDGQWVIGAPSDVSIQDDHGLIVINKARHHAIAAKLDKAFEFVEDGKPLVLQYEAQFEEGQECGGGYLKLLSQGSEKSLENFQDKTPYTIMFGPDKCGPSGKVHLIFKYTNPKNGSVDEYHAKQPDNIGTSYWDDHKTHLYTLVVKSSGDYEVKVDERSLFYGNLLKNVNPSLTPPEIIADPEDKKPEDWDDRAEIDDETAVKPEDWDESQPKEVLNEAATKPSDWLEDENELIPDPEAARPSDWDDDMDGEWEPPMINNPACVGKSGCGEWKRPSIPNPLYKGKWRRPKVANLAFKGVWTAQEIPNPHHFLPTPFGGLAPISAIGIELWTMSERIIFDNILVTDSEELAAEVAAQTYAIRKQEAERYARSKGDGGGFWYSLSSTFNERPWLFLVLALCVILPGIGIAMCCFGRKSSAPVTSADALRKKTDALVPDDDENLAKTQKGNKDGPIEEEIEDEEDQEKNGSHDRSRTNSQSSSHSHGVAKTYGDLEDSGSDMEVGYEEDELKREEAVEETPASSNDSESHIAAAQKEKTTAVKRKPRKDQ
ncbi:unnamed protein product, partial [Mesorhabditis belari]|uniref:Calnexin n=1 Tax=Mesorhabditis belari TaxID=2138241 RepID=A0AAF3EAA6_9BILA